MASNNSGSASVSVDFVDHSVEVLAELQRKIDLALNIIGNKAEGYAKDDCPVDTGRLRNSITFATPTMHSEGTAEGNAEPGDYDLKGSPEPGTVYIGTNVEYGQYVEYRDATHKTGKAHFLRDAATTHSDEYKNIVETTLKS